MLVLHKHCKHLFLFTIFTFIIAAPAKLQNRTASSIPASAFHADQIYLKIKDGSDVDLLDSRNEFSGKAELEKLFSSFRVGKVYKPFVLV